MKKVPRQDCDAREEQLSPIGRLGHEPQRRPNRARFQVGLDDERCALWSHQERSTAARCMVILRDVNNLHHLIESHRAR